MRGRVGVVLVNPDTPAPRCLVMRADQRLRVRNGTSNFGQPGYRVVVTFGKLPSRTLDDGSAVTFRGPVGDIVGHGFHDLELELHGLRWIAEIRVLDGLLQPSSASDGVRLAVVSHCGVHSATVNGRLWLADPQLRGDNPPPGWDENETLGYFIRTGPQRAEFHGDGGQRASFRRAPPDTTDPNAGCE